jgi:ribosomal-protein-alanine N-acetyltransferase
MVVPPIVSKRLELVSMSPAFMRASLAGDLGRASRLIRLELPAGWPGEAEHLLRMRLQQLERNPAVQPWLARAMTLRESPGVMVGVIGFHAEPDAGGKVEIGYEVEPPYQRRGLATEAVLAMFEWARREHGVSRFVASVGPANTASLGLIRKLGFVQTGKQWDERDGEELVFELSSQSG